MKVHLVTQSCAALGIYPKNFCIKKLYIQSINELITFDITKAVKFLFTDLEINSNFSFPIYWSSNKIAIFPSSTGFKLTDDGYNYLV
jgi:hypothetical protein